MTIANITSEWENGCLVFRDNSGYIIDVQAPIKAIMAMGVAASGWTVAGVNAGTMAVGQGIQTITLGNAEDDDVDVASGVVFNAAKGLSIEVLLRNDDVDKTCLNVGFSDATGEGANLIAAEFTTATLLTTASDAALFFHDADATTDYWRAATVVGDTESTILSSAVAPVDGTEYKLRIDIDLAGAATFWLDNVLLGTADQTLSTPALCAYIGFIGHPGASDTCDIIYAAAWQWTR